MLENLKSMRIPTQNANILIFCVDLNFYNLN